MLVLRQPYNADSNVTVNPGCLLCNAPLLSQVVAKPGSTKVFKEFEGEVYALTKEEGGRHTPFTNNYRPQFFFRTADVTGAVRA